MGQIESVFFMDIGRVIGVLQLPDSPQASTQLRAT